jgi:hypothetical protein
MVRNQNPFGIKPIGLGFEDKPKRDKNRSFGRTQRNEIWAQQKGKCAKCHKTLDPRTVEYDHGKAWSAGGRTLVKNGRALCPTCHKLKTHSQRLKKVESKKRTRTNNPFDLGLPKIRI